MTITIEMYNNATALFSKHDLRAVLLGFQFDKWTDFLQVHVSLAALACQAPFFRILYLYHSDE